MEAIKFLKVAEIRGADPALLRAARIEALGSTDDKEDELLSLIGETPKSYDELCLLSRIYCDKGEFDTAVERVNAFPSLDPSNRALVLEEIEKRRRIS